MRMSWSLKGDKLFIHFSLIIVCLMFLKATPKNKPVQFTPALEKLFNRVLARVYRGNVRKKCSKERLLSLQHTQPAKACHHPITIVTSRPLKSSHTLPRKGEFMPQRSAYTEHLVSEGEMKKFSSFYSERSTDGSFGKSDRCRTQANKCSVDDQFNKTSEIGSELMIRSELFSAINNKIQSPIKNRLALKPQQHEDGRKIECNKSELVKEGSRIKQFESRRRISTIIRTKNKLESELMKNNCRQFFEPWDVEKAEDLFF